MPLNDEKQKHIDMPPITLFRLVCEGEGQVVRFTALGDDAERVLRKLLEHELARKDGWQGFLEVLVQSRYLYDERMTRFHIVAEATGDADITWHRERTIECADQNHDDVERMLTDYKVITH